MRKQCILLKLVKQIIVRMKQENLYIVYQKTWEKWFEEITEKIWENNAFY